MLINDDHSFKDTTARLVFRLSRRGPRSLRAGPKICLKPNVRHVTYPLPRAINTARELG